MSRTLKFFRLWKWIDSSSIVDVYYVYKLHRSMIKVMICKSRTTISQLHDASTSALEYETQQKRFHALNFDNGAKAILAPTKINAPNVAHAAEK
jgi:hypothetical protein